MADSKERFEIPRSAALPQRPKHAIRGPIPNGEIIDDARAKRTRHSNSGYLSRGAVFGLCRARRVVEILDQANRRCTEAIFAERLRQAPPDLVGVQVYSRELAAAQAAGAPASADALPGLIRRGDGGAPTQPRAPKRPAAILPAAAILRGLWSSFGRPSGVRFLLRKAAVYFGLAGGTG
jgi:hypothetical protein